MASLCQPSVDASTRVVLRFTHSARGVVDAYLICSVAASGHVSDSQTALFFHVAMLSDALTDCSSSDT